VLIALLGRRLLAMFRRSARTAQLGVPDARAIAAPAPE
jgi:hypothetical protein